MAVKQKILLYPKPFDHQAPNRNRETHIESNCCPKRLRAGMTTGLIAVGPSKANWFWQLKGPELLVTHSPYN